MEIKIKLCWSSFRYFAWPILLPKLAYERILTASTKSELRTMYNLFDGLQFVFIILSILSAIGLFAGVIVWLDCGASLFLVLMIILLWLNISFLWLSTNKKGEFWGKLQEAKEGRR